MSASTVGRWHEGRLKPHRSETFKFSRDPELVAKVTDVVGLYLNPPERAIVLSVDEKTQIQALDRTQPMLPLRPGQVERHTHDYRRNGTLGPVRRPRRRDGQGHGADPGAPYRRRLPGVPAPRGPNLPQGRGPRRARQRQHPQDARRPGVARAAQAVHLPLHPDLRVVDEPGRRGSASSRQAIRRASFRTCAS